MNCQSCKMQKNSLRSYKSVAVPSLDVKLCGECRKKGYEPRHILILAARSGINIRDWIVGHKYCGKELTAEEITI